MSAFADRLIESVRKHNTPLCVGLDPFADASFTSYLSSCVAFMGDSMPTFKSTRYGLGVHSPPGSGTPYSVVERGMTVTALGEVERGEDSVTLEPTTVNKTGIDYYYQVEEIAASAMTQGLQSEYYANAALLQMPPTGKTIASGFLAADSLWKYLDAGYNLQQLQNYLVSKTVGPTPGSTFKLPAPMFYQVRFFSGGFGVGNYAAQ